MSNHNATSIYRVSRSDPPVDRGLRFRADYHRSSQYRLSAHGDYQGDNRIDPQKLKILPATAEVFFGETLEKFQFKGTLETLFAGTRDGNSPLSVLREREATVVREIHSYLANQWAKNVKLTVPAALVGSSTHHGKLMQFNYGRNSRKNWTRRAFKEDASTTSRGFDDGFVAFARVGQVVFPKPNNRNVNMMPFKFGDKASLQNDLQVYYSLIEECPYMKDDVGKVGYLTVQETFVDVGQAQRREGLHIESPGVFADSAFTPGVEHAWGMGMFYGPDRYDGGIFMASSVADTSELFDALVDSSIPGIVEHDGGCEHLRGLIGQGTKLDAGELIWMTDKTPHEALPQKESGYRTFFRVVGPNITHWYADHCTSNPKVPLPDDIIVVKGNKFMRSLSDLEV